MLTRDDAVALFERRRSAWLAGDLDGYLALWAEDMRFQSPVHVEPLVGRPAFAELVRFSFELSRPVAFEFAQIAVVGDAVLAEWRITVERRDSGRRIAWWGMSVCQVERGLIVSWREYWNPSDVM